MQTTRCAVIGVGHVGRFHATKYAILPNAELVAVADSDRKVARRVAASCGGCAAVGDYRDLLGQVDAVSIAVPAGLHYEIAHAFLERGTHVLVEKPITVVPEQAQRLNDMARRSGTILQVGHLERFNPAVAELCNRGIHPLFIEAHRLAPFSLRASGVDVVRDLMIHDLDIILQLARAPLKTLSASGARVLSERVDIVNARLEFANGCVANVTASRVSLKTERKMRVFLRDAYMAIDFRTHGFVLHRVATGQAGAREIVSEERLFGEQDAIQAEIVAFLDAIQTGRDVIVSGEDGQRALELAALIEARVRESAPLLGAAS